MVDAHLIAQISQSSILGKGDFLDEIEKPNTAMYVYKNDAEENIGIAILTFSKRTCNIHDFAVFEKGKGLGTELYKQIKELILAKGCKEVILWCPFEGAQEFWKAMDFLKSRNSNFVLRVFYSNSKDKCPANVQMNRSRALSFI